MIRTIHAGLGPIGLQIVRASVDEQTSQPVAAVDINPELVGKRLGEVTDRQQLNAVAVEADLESTLRRVKAAGGAEVLVLATGSKIPSIANQIMTAIEHGLNVVSTSEELNWPWLRHPELAEDIAKAARQYGVTVVGTGINPGFLLDLLPLLLCRPCQGIEKVTARRIVNVSLRRRQLQKKIGSGLTPEEYRALAAEGKVGHVGLGESAAMLAAGLGWEFDSVDESIEPVIAKEKTGTEYFDIEPGQVMGSHQVAQIASRNGKVVELICRMTHGEPDPRDEVVIEGEPPVKMRIDHGIFGDTATAGCTVNIVRRVVAAGPGLLTVKDLPVA